MRVENSSVIIWHDGEPMLWRAGAISAEAITADTVYPESAIVGLPSDAVRTTAIDVTPQERKHLAKSLPFMMEEQVAEDVDDLHFVSAPLTDEHF